MTVPSLPEGLILSYYGDDFTGSTDVAEVLTFHGLPTVLFLGKITPDQAARFPEARVIGRAGLSRSKPPGWMEAELPAIYEQLRDLGAPICHYKVCSTFDSAPHIGNIALATRIGQQAFGSRFSPLVVGAPALDRFVVFGNLFARAAGETYRLDRHPTMRRHPVTPMTEGDLREVLRAQGADRVELLDLLEMRSPDYRSIYEKKIRQADVVLLDTLDEESLVRAGELVWEYRQHPAQFMSGSSGLEYALVAYFGHAGMLPSPQPPEPPRPVKRIVAVSGSCSPQTAIQIEWAVANGFAGLRLDPVPLASKDLTKRSAVIEQALGHLANGSSVILFSASGPDDPAIATGDAGVSQRLAEATGDILREVLLKSGVRRAAVAGGDTSSHAGSRLGAYALTPVRPLAPGSPLCRLWADNEMDGVEIVFKGGQRGEADFFDQVRRGG